VTAVQIDQKTISRFGFRWSREL